MASVRVTGTYVTNSLSPEPIKAFIPYPLPPEPPLNLSGEHYELLARSGDACFGTAGRACRATSSRCRFFVYLFLSMPLITIPRASHETTISVPTVTAALARLEELGIVREITSRRRDKLYSYEKYIHLLTEGTEPIR